MSEHESGHAECPFTGSGEELVNVKFFRGSRNDVITAAEIREQAHSAHLQVKLKKAHVSNMAPVSSQARIDVREFVKTL